LTTVKDTLAFPQNDKIIKIKRYIALIDTTFFRVLKARNDMEGGRVKEGGRVGSAWWR